MQTALRIHQLDKHFGNGRHALRDINLTVQRGEMVALIGASGSGRSTLLRHVAGLVAADGASDSLIEIDGRCVQRGGRIHGDIRKVRAQVGFVFQQFNLVARLPVLVNVLVGSLHRAPWWRSWMRAFTREERALALDALATSGFLVPGFYVFAKNKTDAKSVFKLTRSANHETNALAVANKQVDVATNNSENLEKVKDRSPDKFASIKVVWTSPL